MSASLGGQTPIEPVVNPRAIEFDLPPARNVEVTGYRVELFESGADTTSASPVRVLNVRKPNDRSAQIRIDLQEWLETVPDGEYVATVRAVGRQGTSPRSAPSGPFIISGHGERAEQRPARVEDRPAPVEEPPAPVQPREPPAADSEREPLVWTVVGIAMGVAAFVLGFFIR